MLPPKPKAGQNELSDGVGGGLESGVLRQDRGNAGRRGSSGYYAVNVSMLKNNTIYHKQAHILRISLNLRGDYC